MSEREYCSYCNTEFICGQPCWSQQQAQQCPEKQNVVGKELNIEQIITELKIAGERMEIQAAVMKDWSLRFYALADTFKKLQRQIAP